MPQTNLTASEAVADLVIAAIPEDERLWVPQADNVWFRPLMLNTTTVASRSCVSFDFRCKG